MTRNEVEKLASKYGVESNQVEIILKQAGNNATEIAQYLKQAIPEYGELALDLALVLETEDLQTIKLNVLLDHLEGASIYEGIYTNEVFIEYVLQPRIAQERLQPYREFFQGSFTFDQQEMFLHNPREIKIWIDRHIIAVTDELEEDYPTPKAVFEAREGCLLARQILFAAMARSFGIAARLLPVEGRLEYLHEDEWRLVELNFC